MLHDSMMMMLHQMRHGSRIATPPTTPGVQKVQAQRHLLMACHPVLSLALSGHWLVWWMAATQVSHPFYHGTPPPPT
jgi:hypothetical protein